MCRPSVSPKPACILRAFFALAWLALLTGCWLDGPQSTFDVKGPVARAQLDVFMVTVYVTAFIFVVVGAVLAYATLKFRARSAADEHAEPPPQGHGNFLVEVGLVSASVLCLVIIAVPTLKNIWFTYEVPEAQRADAFEVTATGYQWWFRFEYPNEQIAGVGPLVTGNELVVPAGRPVHVNLRTVDVIHSFWVPKLAGKVDMIPNRANHLWFQADEPGYYYGQCAEFCGDAHAIMRFRVIALPAPEFAAWLANQEKSARVAAPATASAAPARPHAVFASYRITGADAGDALSGSPKFNADPLAAWKEKQAPDPAQENPALIAEGRRLFQQKTCIACHTIRGHEGVGVTGPDLTHVGARTTIAAGTLENTPQRMHDWIADPDHFKPGNKMYQGGYIDPATGRRLIHLNETEIHALVAYLQSLK
ncbi:MAG: cytochrome c oxidase subunit II [Opitutaceae bacterium]|nr:cytochrome c oxidase subunit II [Opitutaceae bacterium]